MKRIVIPHIQMVKKGNLWSNLPDPSVQEGKIDYFESDALQMYNQGLVLYETKLQRSGDYKF